MRMPLQRLRKINEYIVLLLVCGVCMGQGKPSQSVSAKGTCAVSHKGNNDTIIIKNCGVGEEQLKKIEDLLNKVLDNNDLAEINTKLDRLLASVTPPKILFPKLPWEEKPSAAGHPRMSDEFFLDKPDDSGQFAIVCDRSCTPVAMCTFEGPNPGVMGHIVTEPDIAVFLFMRQVPALTPCTLTVESDDDKPIKIVGMKPVHITDGRNFILGPVQQHHCVITGGGSRLC
jgi:hypothetical protein